MQVKVAIVEVGDSHDECILSQLIALKKSGAWIAFCSSKELFQKNSEFVKYIDDFYEVTFPKTMLGDFMAMLKLNQWFQKTGVKKVIANTAQGGHIRNLCLTASKKIQFYGIVHTIKLLNESFTQRLISKKIKTYFVLNDELQKRIASQKGIEIHTFYPLSYPHFKQTKNKSPNEIWIGIVGGVENRRKDLAGFLKMAQQTPENVHFYFLGKSNLDLSEVQIFIQQIKDYQLSKRVHYFIDFLQEQDFNAYLNGLDGIFPLVHPNTESAKEYFSRQISGAINLAFSYKIPMMIHESYSYWEDFQSGVIFYNLAHFQKQFNTFIEQKKELKNQLTKHPKFNEKQQNNRFAEIVLR